MPAGRPTDYKPEYCEQLIEHMRMGYSYDTFAAVADVCVDTLYEWEKKHPEFSDAKKRARIKGQLVWEQMGMQGMRTEGAFNSAVWIFNMKNRFKWHDQVKVEADIKTEDKKDERLNEVLALLQSEFKK
jgi:hypothetical protein